MSSLARWCVRHRRSVLAGWLVVAVGLLAAVVLGGAAFKTSAEMPDSESGKAYALLAQMSDGRAAGRPLARSPGTADLAAYRIVQEALTNTSKHGTRPYAALSLSYRERTLDITVSNPAAPSHSGPGTGHGLIGMRERAESAGGRFTAEVRAGGDFVVQAGLPLASNRKYPA